MKKQIHIAVLGGGGKTGIRLVESLVLASYRPRVLLRRAPVTSLPKEADVVYGDALSIGHLQHLLRGCEALISVIGQRPGEPMVASKLMTHLLELLPVFGIRRCIVLAGLNVTAPMDRKGPAALAATEWMRTTFPEIHTDRQEACEKLFASSLAWTLVRVPLIDFASGRGRLLVGLFDCPGTSIDVLSLVEFLGQQLTDDSFIGGSPFVASERTDNAVAG